MTTKEGLGVEGSKKNVKGLVDMSNNNVVVISGGRGYKGSK